MDARSIGKAFFKCANQARACVNSLLLLVLISFCPSTFADENLARFSEIQKQMELQQAPAELKKLSASLQMLASISAPNLVQFIKGNLPFPVDFRPVARAEQSPYMAVTTINGTCVVIKNTSADDYPAWTLFLNAGGIDPSSGTLFAVLHELGHCVNKLTPSVTYGVAEAGRDSETFADLYAFAWLNKLLPPSEFRTIANSVVTARAKQSGFFTRSHATANTLKAALQATEAALPSAKNQEVLAASRLTLDDNLRIQ